MGKIYRRAGLIPCNRHRTTCKPGKTQQDPAGESQRRTGEKKKKAVMSKSAIGPGFQGRNNQQLPGIPDNQNSSDLRCRHLFAPEESS